MLLFSTSCSHQSKLTHYGDKLGTNLKAVSPHPGPNNQGNTKPVINDSPAYLKEDYLLFDGKQCELNIFLECTTGFMEASYLESIYNPFSEYYVASDKRLKQEYHRQIEKKYNISIQYINGGSVCDLFDGPATYERALSLGKADNIHAVISSNLLKPGTISSYPNPSLCGFGNAEYYTGNFLDKKYNSLYDIDQKEGFFKDVQYVPDQLKQDLSTYFGQIYTYIPQKVYALDFLYYPSDLENKYQLQKQYEEGNWNYETINQWIKEDTSGMWTNHLFPYTHAEEYLIGLFSANNLITENIFDMENDEILNTYWMYTQYGSDYELEFFRPFQLLIHDQLISHSGEKYEAIPFPSSTKENTISITSAPGYAFPCRAKLNDGLDSETVFKIIYELEDGYRYQNKISEDEKMCAYLSQYLSDESVKLVMAHQENLKFYPYTKLLEAINVMLDDSTYCYLEKILKNMSSQNLQSTQEVKSYLNQLTISLQLIDQNGGYVDFKGTYFELCQYYFNLIFDVQLGTQNQS